MHNSYEVHLCSNWLHLLITHHNKILQTKTQQSKHDKVQVLAHCEFYIVITEYLDFSNWLDCDISIICFMGHFL